MTTNGDSDLLYGVPAIATHLGLTDRTVYHLHGKGTLPTFKVGKVVCARRSSLATWLAKQEAASRPGAGPVACRGPPP